MEYRLNAMPDSRITTVLRERLGAISFIVGTSVLQLDVKILHEISEHIQGPQRLLTEQSSGSHFDRRKCGPFFFNGPDANCSRSSIVSCHRDGDAIRN
jgi:hypothetical protein